MNFKKSNHQPIKWRLVIPSTGKNLKQDGHHDGTCIWKSRNCSSMILPPGLTRDPLTKTNRSGTMTKNLKTVSGSLACGTIWAKGKGGCEYSLVFYPQFCYNYNILICYYFDYYCQNYSTWYQPGNFVLPSKASPWSVRRLPNSSGGLKVGVLV